MAHIVDSAEAQAPLQDMEMVVLESVDQVPDWVNEVAPGTFPLGFEAEGKYVRQDVVDLLKGAVEHSGWLVIKCIPDNEIIGQAQLAGADPAEHAPAKLDVRTGEYTYAGVAL